MSATLTPLEDVCISINSGGTPSRQRASYWDGGTIPWIKTGELNDWKVQSIGERITEEGLNNSSAKIYAPGTILLAMYGDGKTITTMGIVDKPSATNQACCALVADPQICDPLYLFYALRDRRSGLLNLVVAGAQRNLSVGTIRKFPIPFHPLETQRQIARILGAYDDLIEVNRRRIEVLEEMTRKLFTEWFSHLRFPGHEDVAIEDTPDGPLPTGWHVRSVEGFGDVITGKTPSKAEPLFAGCDIPFVKIPDLHGTMFVHRTGEMLSEKGAASQANKTVPAGSICVSCIGTIGLVAVTTRACQTNQQINTVIPHTTKETEFLYYSFLHAKSNLVNLGSNGATMGNVNKRKFSQMKLVCPPQDLMNEFHQRTSPALALISTLEVSNLRLSAARDLLLPRLISGQLSVIQAGRELEVA